MKAARSEEDQDGDVNYSGHVRTPQKRDLLLQVLAVRAEKIRLHQRSEQLQTMAHGIEREALNMTQTLCPSPVPPSQIPVSQTRLRRRRQQNRSNAAAVSSAGHIRKHTDISKYRPGYTWNKGGRVKELRIRNLARKFLNLWKRNVFGRVLPLQAQAHYRMSLLERMFGVWHLYWWELRQEWRLLVRAECHYRYVMWLKVFGAWKDFVVQQAVKKAKEERATHHYEQQLCRRALQGWLAYRRERQQRMALRHKADQLQADITLRIFWKEWKLAFERKNALLHMDSVALQFWAYRMQTQHWQLWQLAMKLRHSEKQRLAGAAEHSHRMLKARCFKHWLLYCRCRQAKKKHIDYARQIHTASVKLRVFSHWYKKWHVRRAMARHQDRMVQLANGFQTRLFFLRWKYYAKKSYVYTDIESKHEESELLQQADQYHQRHLVSLGFSAFRLCVIQRRIKIMRQNMAVHLHQHQVQRRCFGIWLRRVESMEEEQQQLQTQRAREHYRKVLMGKVFQQLVQYKKWRTHRKGQYVKADTHYYLCTVPCCFFRMKDFVQMMKNHRENVCKAAEFHRESLLLKIFMTWKHAYHQSKDVRLMQRMAILHSEDTLVRSCFTFWKAALVLRLQDRDKETEADEHYRAELCRSHLRAWCYFVRQQKKGQEDVVKSIRHHYLTALKHSFSAWKQYVQGQKQKNMLHTRAHHHFRQKLYRKCVLAWRQYVNQANKVGAAAEVKYLAKCQQTLRWSFQSWRDNCQVQITERQFEKTASIHFSKQLLTKILHTWQRYAAIHAYKKSQTRHMVEEARHHLDTCTVRIYLHTWTAAKDKAVVQRLKMEMAIIHYNRKLLTATLCQWQHYHNTVIRKQLLQRQSTWFYSVRLTAMYFLLWKQQRSASVQEKQKSSLALWHWSLVLQRKVLQAWFLYKEERLRKKRRIASAMEARRLRLMKEGAAQWVQVALALSESRMARAAQQLMQNTSTQIHLARRCALHWKEWAARRVLSRHSTRSKKDPSSQAGQWSSTIHWSVPTVTSSSGTQSDLLPLKSELPPARLVSSPSELFTTNVKTAAKRFGEIGKRLRPKPRRPAFLVESLKKAGLLTNQQCIEEELSALAHQDEATEYLHGEHFGVAKETSEASKDPPGEVKTARDYAVHLELCSGAVIADTAVKTTSPQSQPCERDAGKPILQSSPVIHKVVMEMLAPTEVVKHFGGSGSANGDIVGSELSYSTSEVLLPAASVEGTLHHTPVLMKPEDFLRKRDGTEFQGYPHSYRRSVDEQLSKQDREEGKPHGILLTKETDSSSDTSPLNTARSRGSVSFASIDTSSSAEELRDIRDHLRRFQEQKKKLRELQRQEQQLSAWLQQQNPSDSDTCQLSEEVDAMRKEIDVLQSWVSIQRPSCEKLIIRAKVLSEKLGTAW